MTELKTSLAAHKKAALALAAVLLAALLACGLWFALRGSAAAPESEPQSAEKAISVRTIAVSPTSGDVALRYTGLVQPAELTQVSAATVGKVEKIYVSEGEAVSAGQLLVQLDDSDAARQAENYAQLRDTASRSLETAQRSYDRALADYEAARAGAPEGDLASARSRLDTARSRESAAQAEVDSINAALAAQQAAVDAAQREFDAAQSAYNAAAAAQQERINAAQQALDIARANLAADPNNPALQQAVTDAESALQTEQNALTNPPAGSELAEAAEKLETARSNLTTARADLVQLQSDLGLAEAQAELTAAQSERAAAQTAYDALAAQGPDSAETRAQKERLDTAQTALDQAKTNYDNAQRNYETALEAVEDCKLRADADGYVVTVVSSEGSLATPLAPVLVLGSRGMVARFGVSQSDVRELAPEMPAAVTLDGRQYAGSILSIAVLPDEDTRTYPVDVSIGADFSEVYLGSMATVELQIGQRTGVWLPLSVILNDGEDYVYLVEDGRAVRRNVEIAELSNDMVLVTGVHEGGQVISEGMKTVRSGSPVEVLGAEEG